MSEILTIKASDLVLKVSENVDPAVFDISRYEAFLDTLCGPREFQKEAIRTILRYLLGRRYKNLIHNRIGGNIIESDISWFQP